jgi:KaiC/GvpD/RAD55 family RecA-like ATPase
MPTFQSIPIHPSVTARFIQLPERQHQIDRSGVRPQRHHNNISAGVATPRALLARDTQELVEIFTKGEIKDEQQRAGLIEQMEGIRCQIAHTMCAKTRHGRHVQKCHERHLPCPVVAATANNSNEPLVPGGTLTALQSWILLKETVVTKKPYVFSTGCRALDELVSFPEEYHPNYADANAISGKGILRGHVLFISGNAGKTQFALQLAAQVVLQSHGEERVRYCYSTVGHSGRSLAKRTVDLLGTRTERGGGEKARQIEFQPIVGTTGLLKTLAELEDGLSHQICLSQGPGDEGDSVLKQSYHPPAMIVIDSFSAMLQERDDRHQIMQLMERRLKRLARLYFISIVVTAVGGPATTTDADIHVHLHSHSADATSLQLIRHPTKVAYESILPVCITKSGVTAPNDS